MNKLKRKDPTVTSTPGSASSDAPVSLSRKKRVRNPKSVGDLPESLFKKHQDFGGKVAGLEKRPRKNQGGVQPRRKQAGNQPSLKTAVSVIVQAEGRGGLGPNVEDQTESLWSQWSADHDTVDHVDRGADHETDPTRDTRFREGPPLSDSSDDEDSGSEWDNEIEYEAYAEAVRSNVACFLPVCGNIFVVQGWSALKFHTTSSFYHLRFQPMGNGDLSVACTCPAAAHGDCFHIRYFKQCDIEEKAKGSMGAHSPMSLDVNAALFAQKYVPGIGLDSRFSVQSKSVVELRGRAIVHHRGASRDTAKLKGTLNMIGVSNVRAEGESPLPLLKAILNKCSVVRGPGQTISYLPIHPPLWAGLESDPTLYTPLPEFRVPPPNTIFRLEPGDDKGQGKSTCADEGRTKFDPTKPTEIRDCKFYSLLNVYQVKIEVQLCPSCPREKKRYIGPDLRTRGIFNYNNRVLVSHELLDEYTSTYTSAEKPAWSYVQDIDRRYKREKGKLFMGADSFRAIWFSYVHLQQFTDDMNCKTCGPTPKTVIFDGISLGYSQKHLKDSLKPPTTISEHSMVRQSLDYTRQQQVLPDTLLRWRVRMALEGPDFDPLMEDLEERMGSTLPSPWKSRQKSLVRDHLELIEWVYQELRKQGGTACPELAELFNRHFGQVAYATKGKHTKVVRGLAAEESVIQMINFASLADLREYLKNPTLTNSPMLVSIPAFHKAITSKGCDVPALNSVMRWVELKARIALNTLIKKASPPMPLADPATLPKEEEWRKVGICFLLTALTDDA
ncbi:hypothetical protein FA13DRAFT_1621478 [Coprinellus micaceus]|uniref:HMG domain-containing protein n=1 Tax=Coprinellus micaceus TaxID=71717 RepID=A0A4Y7TW72_COPMI|nr:hypothetical protein FA13DRAFT_1621478 [Coprinellus micaceus]